MMYNEKIKDIVHIQGIHYSQMPFTSSIVHLPIYKLHNVCEIVTYEIWDNIQLLISILKDIYVEKNDYYAYEHSEHI